MNRAIAALAALFLLASCQAPNILVHAAFVGGALAFVAADPDDSDVRLCLQDAVVVDDRAEPAWEVEAPGLGECRPVLPIIYGRTPEGASAKVAPRRIEPGRLYLFLGGGSDGQLEGAFAFSRAGRRTTVRNVDPESPEARALRSRWWARRQDPARLGR
ncbi:MAG TPA: hypothetical protein VF759_08885 [Allosphingosinicella sp.]|jgi:hypothetical protein